MLVCETLYTTLVCVSNILMSWAKSFGNLVSKCDKVHTYTPHSNLKQQTTIINTDMGHIHMHGCEHES